MTPLHLSPAQLDLIRQNSLNDDAYEAILAIITSATDSHVLTNCEQKLQRLLESTHDPIVIYDEVGHVAYVNELFTQTFGWTAEEIHGQRLDFVPEGSQQETAQAIQALMENGRAERFHTRRYRKDGTTLQTEISINSLTDQEGHYSGMIEVLRNVTQLESIHTEPTAELQAAYKHLERQNQLLNALNNLAAEINYSIDSQAIWTAISKFSVETINATSAYVSMYDQVAKTETVMAEYISSAASAQEQVSDLGETYDFEKDFGQLTEDFMSRPYHLSHVDDPAIPQAEREHMAEYGAKSTLSVPLVANHELIGSLEIWESREKREFSQSEIETIIAFARLAGNSIYNAQLYNQANRELTAKQEAENALAFSETKFKTLVENSITAIYIIQDGYYKYVNEAFCDITGFTADELMAQPVLEFVHPADQALVEYNVQRRLAGEIETINYQLRFVTKDGTYIIMEVHGSASEYEGEPAVLGAMLNVTDQQQTQERLQLALDSGNIGIWEWNIATNEVFWSDNIEPVLNIPTGTFDGQFESYIGMIHPDDVGLFNTKLQKALGEGIPFEIENRIIRPDGQIEWIAGLATVIQNADGSPARMIGTVRNITQSKESETQLRENEQLLRLVLDTIPLSVFWKDRDGRYLGCNQNFANDAGFVSPNELIGKTDYEASWTKEEADFFVATDQRVMEQDKAELNIIEPQSQASGKQAWLETSKVPIHDTDDQVIGILGMYQDVTERQAAREQINYQAKLLQVISDAVIAVDEKYHIQAWNRAAEELYGYTKEEVSGKFIGKFIKNEYYSTPPGEGEKILLKEGNFADRAKQTIANGREIQIDNSSTLLTDESGNISGFVAVNRDITELIKTEENLQQSQARLAQLVEQSPLAFVEWDENFCIREWNNAAAQIFGYTREEAIGQHARLILPEDLWPAMDDIWHHLTHLTGGERSINQNITADGQEIVCDWYNRSLVDNSGKVTGVVSIVENITERQQADDELKQSQQRLAQLIEQSPLAFIEWDENFCIREWNKAAENIFGHTRQEALGQHARFILPEVLWPAMDDIWEHLTNLTGGERSTNQNVTADGRLIDCDWYNTPLIDSEGRVTGVVSIMEEITERLEQEKATQKRQKLIEKQSQLSLLISEEMITSQGRQHALQVITEEATNMLDVARASVWSYHKNPEAIHLLDLYEKSEQAHSKDVILSEANAPSYFKALVNERILIADDVYEHYSTQDLIGFYLEPLGITSMLDTFVRVGDQVRGVVCLEHTGPKREWSLDEQSFANYLADLVNFIFEEEERQQLAAERMRLTSILENTVDFVGIADPNGQAIYINSAGRQMVGLGEEDSLDEVSIASIVPEWAAKDTFEEAIPTAVKHGYWQGDSALLGADGREIPTSQVIVATKNSDGELDSISTIIRDTTTQRQQEEQIRLRLELNQALDEARTESETIKIVTEKAQFYRQVGVGITKRQIIDGQIIDVVVQQAPFESALQPLPSGAPLKYEQITLDAIENDLPFYTNHFGSDERLSQPSYDTSARTGVNSIAILPIFVDGGERYGSLIAVTEEEGFFDSFKVDLYRTLAEQTSISLRGVKLSEQIQQSLERRGRQVQITTQIAQEIASSTEIYELYQRVVELTKEEFGYYHTQLLQYNPALDAVALIVGYGDAGQKMIEYGHSMPLGVGIIGTAAATAQPVLRTDVSQDPNWRPNDLLPHTKAELAVPIKLGSEVLGILDIQSDRLGQLTEEDQIMLEGLCGQIAVAIESTRLRQDMNQRLDELNKLQRLMTREGWQDIQTGQSTTHLGYMFDQQTLEPVSNPLAIATNGQSNGHNQQIQQASQVMNPIKVRDEVIGTIQLEETADNPLSTEDQELLDAISRQVAEALENARLIEQTRKRALELETVARVSATTSTILEVEQLLQSVARLTQSSFGLYHTHIYLFDDDGYHLKLAAGTGEIGALMMAENWQVALSEENSIVSRVARARRGMVITDVRQELHHRPNPFMPDTRAQLSVPMIAGDELLGVLDLHSSSVNFFSNEDLRIHTTLATQVAVALQNANLYQEQLETAEKLREFDRLKSQFLASMSHELRTPLNSIIGFADVLLEGIDGELNDRMREDVLLIRDGGQHLRALIGDILDMSKIEAGMMDLTYGLIDIKRIAHEVMATTQGLVKDKPIRLILDMDESLDTIEADRTRLVQILLNLLSNAAKFTDEGSVTLKMKPQDDEFLLIGVKDTGVGIKPQDIKLVFEQFQQIGGMEHRKAGGTGLGMPITKQLVEMHGGKIWIESVPDVGTTFWFTIPMQRPDDLDSKRDGYYA